MNKKILTTLLSLVFFFSTLLLTALYLKEKGLLLTKTEENVITDFETVDSSDYLKMDEYFSTLPQGELSQNEMDGLILMREEEKLAHDVYTVLYDKWNLNIFKNISNSEQTHTDMVLELLNKYGIDDPVINSTVGEFSNDELAKLYGDLVEKGERSLSDALNVGATVEDLDIYDLSILMKEADNEDILAVYQNLTKGSRNHIRSFTRMINRNGDTYESQYITGTEYLSIINSSSENGVTYDADGEAI